jgi:hypothetical protein
MSFHVVLAVILTGLMHSPSYGGVVESDLAITYDKESEIYIVGEYVEKPDFLIYPNGNVEQYSREYTPFTYRRPNSVVSRGLGPKLVASRFAGRDGVFSDGQGFYRLSGDGHHELVDIFAGNNLLCERSDPRDFCVFKQSYESGSGEILNYFHRSLGTRVALWNGSGYEMPEKLLARMGMDDLVDAAESFSHIVPFGSDGDVAVIPLFPEGEALNLGTVYTHDESLEIETDLPPFGGSELVDQVLPLGDKIYVRIVSIDDDTDLDVGHSIYKIAMSDGEVEVNNITPGGDLYDKAEWFGFDGVGTAYGFRPRDHALLAYDISSESTKVLKSCDRARRPELGTADTAGSPLVSFKRGVPKELAKLRSQTSANWYLGGAGKRGVWVLCDSTLLGLNSSEIIQTISMPDDIIRLHVATQVGEPLKALTFDRRGNGEIWRGDIRTPVQSLSPVGSYDYKDLAVIGASYWEDGQKYCRSRRQPVTFFRQSHVECLDNGKWILTDYEINIRDLFEARDYSYALADEIEGPTIYRRSHDQLRGWERLATVIEARAGTETRFIPASSSSGVIGIQVTGVGIFTYSENLGLRKIPVDPTTLVMDLRPAFSDNGWFYAFCKTGDTSEGGEKVAEICSFDWSGSRSDLGRVAESSIRQSRTGGFVPLERGVMADVKVSPGDQPGDFIGRAPILAYRNSSAKLSTIFGEFVYSGRFPWDLKVTMGVNGQAYILKIDGIEDLDDDERAQHPYYHLFELNGRELVKLGSAPRTLRDIDRNPFTYRSVDPWPGSWQQLSQIWKRSDGLWRSNRPDKFVPLILGKSLPSLVMGVANEDNSSPAIVKHNGNVVLANGAGMWFCPESDAPILTAASSRIARHPSCAHRGYVGFPSQMESIANDKILALSGEDIQVIDTNTNKKTVIAHGAVSKFFTFENDQVWFATDRGIFSTSIDTHTTTKKFDLPAGVRGEDVYLNTSNEVCAKSGVYATHSQSNDSWAQMLPGCDAATVVEGGLRVFFRKKLYHCTTRECLPIAELPIIDSSEVIVATQQIAGTPMLIASGKEFYRYDGDEFKKCAMNTALGSQPRSAIKYIYGDLIVTSAGSAISTSCGDQFAAFRIH